MAIGLSTVAILVFMAVYYRFCGIVADVAVIAQHDRHRGA